MAKLIFDIETVGENFDELDKTTQDVLTQWIEKEANDEDEYKKLLEDLKNGLGFSALTGEIVAIGVLDYEKNKSCCVFPGARQQIWLNRKKTMSNSSPIRKKKCSKIFGMERKIIRNS